MYNHNITCILLVKSHLGEQNLFFQVKRSQSHRLNYEETDNLTKHETNKKELGKYINSKPVKQQCYLGFGHYT